jgi:outer membrane protein assembly factor BamD (BamD/ComL family)
MARRRTPPPRTHRGLLLAFAALLPACASVPDPLPTAEPSIAQADALVTAGEPEAALAVLEPIEGDLCPKRLRDKRDIVTARAEFARGEFWRAFVALEHFSDLHPHSELRPTAVDMIWEIGSNLLERDGGFLIFWSDRRAGRQVLEHLITRHPDTQRLADALRILGDMAFEDGDYDTAQERFRDIILNRPESEWRVYAQFRFAMSIVAGLQGPDYDLARMEHAVRELRGFLATRPESPELLERTEAALAQLLEWQVVRHMMVAEFYKTVGSLEGERLHLQLATQKEFSSTPSFPLAIAARDALNERSTEPPAGGRP